MNSEICSRIRTLIDISESGIKIEIKECENFINDLQKFTTKNDMTSTRRFLDYLGAPDENMKIIHVAGTNGKGSVCCYLSNMLIKGGYTVGMFTSPHLVSICERFAVDNKPISDGLFVEIFVELLKRLSEYDEEDYCPTYFEFLFFMAMLLYDVYPVDYLILETGLGGRLDATNSIRKPLVSVITKIDFDHMQYLGNTLPLIASEKAGIIKENVPVIFDDNDESVSEVIRKKAEELNADCIPVEKDYIKDVSIINSEGNNYHIDFLYESRYDKYVALSINTLAEYQLENVAIAITVMCVMKENNYIDFFENAIRSGLKNAKWFGRMDEILPAFYADGAHNISGIEAFLKSVGNVNCTGRRFLLFGVVSDKQYSEMVYKILESGLFSNICLTVLDTKRTVSEADLKAAFEENRQKLGDRCNEYRLSVYTNVRDAVTGIITERKSGDVIFAAGSLYLVGQIKEMLV
ncbi:MAG: bifunctional folylpolyglutamate synthase/dihydrofolate synthase [Butyrivibrio sp.]|nr:bifunctional folylpolyglutamate synthase/dihydrofolate synthase [Butyrivibrio sp.]